MKLKNDTLLLMNY